MISIGAGSRGFSVASGGILIMPDR
jgi:hypothetical protein